MEINLFEAKINFGKTLNLDYVTKVDETCFDSSLAKPVGLCTLHIEYTFTSDGVHVVGQGKIPLEYKCVLCAKPFEYELNFNFDEMFEEGEENLDSKNNYFFKQDVLILDKCLRDSIILATPQNLKCSEDCKGLCPYCYANLNETKCDCEEKERLKSNPFSVLKGL